MGGIDDEPSGFWFWIGLDWIGVGSGVGIFRAVG